MQSDIDTSNRPFNLINNYIYIYHLGDNGEGKFFVLPAYPEQINDSMTATFATTNALARSAPLYSYSYSGPRTVQVSVTLHRDMFQQINWNISNVKIDNLSDDYVDVLIKALQSVAVPRYDANSSVQPPMVAVRFGNELFVKGVVNGNVAVTFEKPLIKYNDDPNDSGRYSQVSLTFTVYEVDPYDALTIEEEGSFRGLTRAFREGIFK